MKPWPRKLNCSFCCQVKVKVLGSFSVLMLDQLLALTLTVRLRARLLWCAGRVTNLRRVTYVVLDEADRMFDMGFEPQVGLAATSAGFFK